MEDQDIEFRFTAGTRNISFLHCTHPGSGACKLYTNRELFPLSQEDEGVN